MDAVVKSLVKEKLERGRRRPGQDGRHGRFRDFLAQRGQGVRPLGLDSDFELDQSKAVLAHMSSLGLVAGIWCDRSGGRRSRRVRSVSLWSTMATVGCVIQIVLAIAVRHERLPSSRFVDELSTDSITTPFHSA